VHPSGGLAEVLRRHGPQYLATHDLSVAKATVTRRGRRCSLHRDRARHGPEWLLPCRISMPRVIIGPPTWPGIRGTLELESADRVRHLCIRHHAKRLTPPPPALQSP